MRILELRVGQRGHLLFQPSFIANGEAKKKDPDFVDFYVPPIILHVGDIASFRILPGLASGIILNKGHRGRSLATLLIFVLIA